MEPAIGFEPMTGGLQNRCSTPELRWRETIISDDVDSEQWFNVRCPGHAIQFLSYGYIEYIKDVLKLLDIDISRLG